MEINWSNCVQTPSWKNYAFYNKKISNHVVSMTYDKAYKIGYYFILKTNISFLIHLYTYF